MQHHIRRVTLITMNRLIHGYLNLGARAAPFVGVCQPHFHVPRIKVAFIVDSAKPLNSVQPRITGPTVSIFPEYPRLLALQDYLTPVVLMGKY